MRFPNIAKAVTDQRGNIMVETAISLPVLVLVLFLGTDFIRFAQLSHKADQVAAEAVRRFSQQQAADLSALESLRQDILNHSGLSEAAQSFEIRGQILEYSAISGTSILWSGAVGDATTPCDISGVTDMNAVFDNPQSVPRQYFSSIRLCLTPKSSFYLTPYFPYRDRAVAVVARRLLKPGSGPGRDV